MSEPTGIEAMVCADIAARQRVGIAKYKVTVAESPAALLEWYRHHYTELLDAAVYTRRIIRDLEESSKNA